MEKKNTKPLVVIASNRGPFSFSIHKDHTFSAKRGEGGLVTALGTLAEEHDVVWVASAMEKGDRKWAAAHDNQVQSVENISLKLITPDRKEYDQYYNTISNPLLWFIQHQLWDLPRNPVITHETWRAWEEGYVPMNRAFAQAIAEVVEGTSRPVIVLPQDYHLYLVPQFLRQLLGVDAQIHPFIHIPWPGPDAWRMLPSTMRDAILRGLLASNVIGFQTKKDAFNFVQTCRFYLPEPEVSSRGRRDAIFVNNRMVKASSYPISIDVEKLEQITEGPQMQLEKSQLISTVGDRKLILRVDRIEPSKNILRGLQAFRALLEEHPEHRGKVQMMCLLVPSRMEVGEYRDYLREIMAEAGMINANYNQPLWEPVRVVVGHNYQRAIAAMQIYDVLVVNPIADGMNLVAKEGALVNQKDGVLVLSEYAGAFFELGEEALTVSPFDIYSTAEAIHKAITMPADERAKRAETLRHLVKTNDIKQWFYAQVEDALIELSKKSNSAATSSTLEAVQSE